MNLTKPQKLLAAGKFAEAENLLPATGTSSDPRVEIIRARIQAGKGDREAAANTLKTLADAHPEYAPAHVFEGIALWDLGKYQQALTSFDNTIRLQKENDLAHSYRALCLCATGDPAGAADTWKKRGFSDNAMFRVRVAEFVESSWLFDQRFMGEASPADAGPSARTSLKKALRHFYRRDFSTMLQHLPATGTENELEVFLAATAHEMLRHYTRAQEYVDTLVPRRAEWPEPLIALNARLMLRRGEIASAARDFSSIVVMGPEDFGVNYYMGIVCLAYEKRDEARQYFLRAFTNYMVDTLEFQWWQIEQVLLAPSSPPADHPADPGP